MEWARGAGVCDPSPEAGCECAPVDSFANYLFPALVRGIDGAPALVYDAEPSRAGAFPPGGGCAAAPFGAADAAEAMSWLVRRGHDGFFSRGLLAAHGLGPPLAAGADDTAALRSTVRLRGMSAPRWAELAALLRVLADGAGPLRLDYGGPAALLQGELLAALAADSRLLPLGLLLTGLCLHRALGCGRTAALATALLALGVPLGYAAACAALRVARLSALASAALWVAAGLAVDNVCVLAAAWARADALRLHGAPLTAAARLEWASRQALPPLAAANAAAAAAMLVHCASPIPALAHFGACGGALVLAHFALVALCVPALLALRDAGRLGPAPRAGARGSRLAAAHAFWYARRHAALAAALGALVLLAPLAVHVAPAADPALTAASDARAGELLRASTGAGGADALFPSPEGRYTSEPGAAAAWVG
eukprot:scaffold87899_cov18-Tisochrysis_lutea.AAC.1